LRAGSIGASSERIPMTTLEQQLQLNDIAPSVIQSEIRAMSNRRLQPMEQIVSRASESVAQSPTRALAQGSQPSE
jgi:hypothetical protein